MNWMNALLIATVAYVLIFVETSLDAFRHFLGVQLHFLPVLMVYASLTHGALVMALLAVLGGLWFDSLSANPLGVTVLPLFLIGWGIHEARGLILRENLVAQLLLGLSASLLCPIFVLIQLWMLDLSPLVGWGTLWQLFVLGLGGAVATPIGFRLLDVVDKIFNYQTLAETTFRSDREIKRGRQ